MLRSTTIVRGTLNVVLMSGLALGAVVLAGCGSSGSATPITNFTVASPTYFGIDLAIE